jgi:hypothetical protein
MNGKQGISTGVAVAVIVIVLVIIGVVFWRGLADKPTSQSPTGRQMPGMGGTGKGMQPGVSKGTPMEGGETQKGPAAQPSGPGQ